MSSIKNFSYFLTRRKVIQIANSKGKWLDPNFNMSLLLKLDSFSQNFYVSFAKYISKISRLSEEEEKVLGVKIRDFNDKQASKKLVLHNMRLAFKMANQQRRSWINLMDLVQEASSGLLVASKKWDPDKGTRFGTYAVYWIKAYLIKFLMSNLRLINTSKTRLGRKLYFKLSIVIKKLENQGLKVTPALIAREIGEDEREIAFLLVRTQNKESSLSSPIRGKGTLQDFIESDIITPENRAAKEQFQIILSKIVNKFAQTIKRGREFAVWNEHLTSEKPISLVDLGKRYGISKQRVSQFAVKLRELFREHVIKELGSNIKLSWFLN